jgi:GT2 family glycosyltransferase
MIQVSISIVNFNTREHLRRCLGSIQECLQDIRYEVVVVDNNSHDASVSMLKEEFPFVRCIANSENKGATIAKNQSFREMSGDYVLIIDSDIEILAGSIQSLLTFMRQNPAVGIVGPGVAFADGRPQHSCNKSIPTLWSCFLNKFFLFASLRYAFYRSKFAGSYFQKYRTPQECMWLGGMCLLVRREVIGQIGGMDERFFIYYDDTDFCLRAHNKGWKVYYLPSSAVIHHMGKGVGQFKNWLYPKIFESELYFFKKHYGSFQAKLCAFLIQMAVAPRMLCLYPLRLWNRKREYYRQRLDAYGKVWHEAGRYLYGKTN